MQKLRIIWRTRHIVLAGVLSLALLALSWADIINTASFSFIDAAGQSRTGVSNTVVVPTPVIIPDPPSISSINPAIVTVGDPSLTATLSGLFPPDSMAYWSDGSTPVTTWVSPTQLSIQIPASKMSGAGNFDLTVKSITGTSNPVVFSVVLFPVAGFDSASYIVPIDSALSLDQAEGVSFTWTLTAAAGSFQLPPGGTPAPAGASASTITRSPQLGFAGLNLGLGTYAVQVTATNAAGKISPPAHTLVTLISSNFGAARIFPNPWRAARGDTTMTFDQMPLNTLIKIFTVSGRFVKKLHATSGLATWDLTNDSGERVASGIYLYICEDDQGNRFRGKFTVIR